MVGSTEEAEQISLEHCFPRIKGGGGGGGGGWTAFKLLVCALYISLRVYCLLMCTPGKKGVLKEREGCCTPLSPLGETPCTVYSGNNELPKQRKTFYSTVYSSTFYTSQ